MGGVYKVVNEGGLASASHQGGRGSRGGSRMKSMWNGMPGASPIVLHLSQSWPAYLNLLPLAFSNSARLDHPLCPVTSAESTCLTTAQTDQRVPASVSTPPFRTQETWV